MEQLFFYSFFIDSISLFFFNHKNIVSDTDEKLLQNWVTIENENLGKYTTEEQI